VSPENFFNQPRDIHEEIIKIRGEIESLDYIMLPCTDFQNPYIQASHDDLMSKYAVKKEALEGAMVDLKRDYLMQRDQIQTVIDKLALDNPRGAIVLSEYYIAHKTIRQIAKDHNYNRQHVYKIKDKAIRQAEKYIKMPPPEQ